MEQELVLGLCMSKLLIEKHCNEELSISNRKDDAGFNIILKINLKKQLRC